MEENCSLKTKTYLTPLLSQSKSMHHARELKKCCLFQVFLRLNNSKDHLNKIALVRSEDLCINMHEILCPCTGLYFTWTTLFTIKVTKIVIKNKRDLP